MKQLIDVIVSKARALVLRYELRRFPSGAVMIDVFSASPGGEMLVFQIEDDQIGISVVDDDVALTSLPDETFLDVSQALARVGQVVG